MLSTSLLLFQQSHVKLIFRQLSARSIALPWKHTNSVISHSHLRSDEVKLSTRTPISKQRPVLAADSKSLHRLSSVVMVRMLVYCDFYHVIVHCYLVGLVMLV